MLPVVSGVPETTRQIALYTVLLVALTLVFFAVAQMGAIYLGRRASSWARSSCGARSACGGRRLRRRRRLAQAIRLYRYSITT